MAERRTFRREFKAEAVRMVTHGDSSVSEVAGRLGIGENLLRRWRRRIEAEGAPAPAAQAGPSFLEEENRRLRAEVERLRMEREILKRATAFFARESR